MVARAAAGSQPQETEAVYKHILIATDGSELAGKAVAAGIALAKQLKSKVTVVTVSEPWTALVAGEMAVGFPYQEYEEGAKQQAAAILAAVADNAKKAGIECTSVHMPDRFPAEAIVDCAKEKGCDLIVMASHGRRGLSKLLLGSETTRVLTHSSVPVLVCR
jgi:nucleotide-binding universal stress UspA family protein